MNPLVNKKLSPVLASALTLLLVAVFIGQSGIVGGILLLVVGILTLGTLMLISLSGYRVSLAPERKITFKFSEPDNYFSWFWTNWLADRVGEPPLSYWRLFSWLCLGIEILDLFIGVSRNFSGRGGYVLPTALVGLVFYIFTQKTKPFKYSHFLTAMALVFIVGTVFVSLPGLLLQRLYQFNTGLVNPLTALAPALLSALSMALILLIIAVEHPPVAIGVKLFLIGTLAGLVLTIILSYPISVWLYHNYIPGVSAYGEVQQQTILFAALVSGIVGLSIGPVVIWTLKPQTNLQKVFLGAVAGGIAGGYVFGFLGGPTAGIVAQATLLPIAITREGFGGDLYIYRLAFALTNILPWAIAATWTLIAGGACAGALGALLVPLPARYRKSRLLPEWKHLLAELSGPGPLILEVLTIVMIVAVYSILISKIQQIFDIFGSTPMLSPMFGVELLFVQHWIMILLLQFFAVLWIRVRLVPYGRNGGHIVPLAQGRAIAVIVTVSSFFLILALYFVDIKLFYRPAFQLFSILSIALTVESYLSLRQLPHSGGTVLPAGSESLSADFLEKPAWHGVGLPVGFFIAILNIQFLLTSLSMVLVAVILIVPMQDLTAQPPGLDWLNQKSLFPLFRVSSYTFLSLLLASLIMSISGRDPLVLMRQDHKGPETEPVQDVKKRFIDLRRLIELARDLWERDWAKKLAACGVLLAGIILQLTSDPPGFFAIPVTFFLAAALLAIDDTFVRKLRMNAISLTFLLICVSTLGMAHSLESNSRVLPAVLGIVLAISVVIVYRAVQLFFPEKQRLIARNVVFVGTSVAFLLVNVMSQGKIGKNGGLTAFDNQSWTRYANSSGMGESLIGGVANYKFFLDSRNRLWFGTGTGAVIAKDAEQWNAYALTAPSSNGSTFSGPNQSHTFFFEDQNGGLWIADGSTFGLLDLKYRIAELGSTLPENKTTTNYAALLKPEDHSGRTFIPDAAVMDAVQTANGDIWLMTHTSVTQFIPGTLNTDAKWETTSFENNLLSIYADRQGRVWIGTQDQFYWLENGEPGGFIQFSKPGKVYSEVVFFEDSSGALWIGTDTGELYLQSKDDTQARPVNDWPQTFAPTAFYEDSVGQLWIGTNQGVLRQESQGWVQIINSSYITTMLEDGVHNLWIGTMQGLIKYTPAGETILFQSNNSGLADNAVRDLMVDPEGRLWVSTYSEVAARRSFPWSDILAATFFAFLFYVTRNRYEKSPETRGRRLAAEVLAEPNRLLPSIYELASGADENLDVVEQLAQQLEIQRDVSGARISHSYATLMLQPENVDLHTLVASLRADELRADAGKLSVLYEIEAYLQDIRDAEQLAAMDLTVNPFDETISIEIHYPHALRTTLPSFLYKPYMEAWQKLEEVGTALKKYARMDYAADRLGYLAQALEALEKAQALTLDVPLPDGSILQAIVRNWREVVRQEIDHISGRAELKLELLTRQIRVVDQVTAVFRLYNSGRAPAENVHIILLSGEDYSVPEGGVIEVDRIASESSQTVEFHLMPAKPDQIRLVCKLLWDDRTSTGHETTYADMMSLYLASQDFHRFPNPYVVGHPLKTDELFQGREDIFTFISENLGGTVSDRTIVLYGQRRTGKTSVLYQLLAGRLGEKFIPVLIDMQEIAVLVSNNMDFLNEIAYQIVKTARKAGTEIEAPPEAALKENPVRAFTRFVDALETSLTGKRLILMFDEFELIEQKIAEGKIDVNLLDYFRSLMQHREYLVFIFTGTHHLEKMSQEYWSVLFNIALYRKINFLNAEEARKLIRMPVRGNLSIDDLVVEKIISLTGGHPYFIQLICWALVNHCNDKQRNYATINDINDVIEEILITGKAHFAYIWHQANEQDRLALVGTAHSIRTGKPWVRPDEIVEILEKEGAYIDRHALIAHLDELAAQEVLEFDSQGALRYRFQIELLRLWIEKNYSIAGLVERSQ